MQLQQAVQEVFLQLSETIRQMSDDQYTSQSPTLSRASIGQHIRHIIEMFVCLEEGYQPGVVNYEKRKRDIHIETNRYFALELLERISQGIEKPDRTLILEAAFSADENDVMEFTTNYRREVAYNLEHTIHHMALIKIGLRELTEIEIPEGFGVASSTMKYKKECAQ
ncbi:MAG: DinB family protein [Chitinophagaceae bacterium]|nr:DinB family protein [Chitinophagaceae bacterium]